MRIAERIACMEYMKRGQVRRPDQEPGIIVNQRKTRKDRLGPAQVGVLEYRCHFAKQDNTQAQVTQTDGAERQVFQNLLGRRRALAIDSYVMQEDNREYAKHQRRLFAEQGKQVTRLDPETPFPIHLSGRAKQQKSEKNEECRFEVRQCSDPRNDFRVNRVNCKNQRTNAGNAAVVE